MLLWIRRNNETFVCEYLSEETEKPIFEKIFEENIIEQKKVNTIFLENYQRKLKRNQENQTIEISSLDPLYYTGAVMDK